MKKEVSKNKKLGLIIAIAAVVLLAIVGVVLALLLGGEQGEEKLNSKLYWNIDGKSMLSQETAMSTRKPAEDGLFYIRYLVGGEIVEIPFADRKLVTQADRRDLACLKFDADGICIDVVDPEEVYVRIQDKTYVQAIDGNTITTNTSIVLNGMKKKIEIPEGVSINNVSTRTGKLAVGEKVNFEIFDQVLIYGTDEETITDVFVTDRYWESEIYWSTAARSYWNATSKSSTRPLADDGYWYIDLICKGERKTYRTAMQDVIDVLDSKGPTDAATGVVFNDEGDIINLFNAGIACRGTLAVNSYDITDISEDGKSFTATRVMFGTEIGKTFTGNVTEDTQIYNMNATADYLGQPTELQKDDRLLIYTKADGSIHTIFVVNRMVNSPFYYNLNRKWSTVDGLTRTPNEDGYYVYELAVDGKVKTVRTKDRKIAEQMDGMNLAVFGLKLKGDIVTKVYEAVNVAGNWSFCTSNFVQTTDGGILGTVNTAGTVTNGVMAANCKVFDVSQCYKEFRGEKTTVREGDQILAYQNAVGEVTHIWVLNRYMKGTTIYWNCNRYYANGETTRTPDADGYYVFNVIKAGTTKVIQLKTKDKEVANRFDKEGSTTAAALKVKGDIIQAAYPAPAAIGGYYRLSGFWVHDLNVDEEQPNLVALIARTGAIGNIDIADDCKIMNFSQVLNKTAGELTKLRLGDWVWPIAGQDGKIHYIFVVEREVPDSKIAWRKNTLATMKDAEGKVMQDKDGNNMLVADANGYYVFELWVNGKIGTYKTKDLKLANYVNTRATGFAVSVKGDTITGAYPISSQPDTRAASVSYYDYVKVSNGEMTLKRNRVGQTDTGNEMTVKVASNYKAYNFDPAAGDDWGKQVKLNKGDRVYAYSNNNGESYIFFVMYRCTLEGGNERYCDHCGKKVHWESVFAGYGPVAGCVPETAHYYLPCNYEGTGWTLGNATQQAEGVSTEIVFDLNGKTLTRKGTLNTNDGIKYAPGAAMTAGYGNTLRIVDYSKANSGKIVSAADAHYTGAGSLLHVQTGSKLIIEGGLFDGSLGTVNYTGANGGTISVGGELIINGGTIKGRASNGNGSAIGAWGNTSITINGGTLIGNTMTEGVAGVTGFGGVIATNGNLTITGGTISGGTAIKGDNIYVGKADAEVVISGGTIDGGIEIAAAKSVTLSGKPQIAAGQNYGLKLPKGILVDATGLKAGAKVFVDASGVFTTDFASAKEAQAVIDNGMLKAGAEGMILKVEGKAIASVSDGKLREWTDASKLPEMGRWKLMTDVKLDGRMEVTGDLYIDLNGYDITRVVAADATTACQVFRVNGGKLTIDDSTGNNGVVSTAYAEGQAINDYSAVIHVTDTAELVLEGGIIDGSNVDNTYVNASNGTISVGGKLTVNGGVIKGVKRSSGNGGAIGAWAGSEIIVNGGEIYAGGSFLNDKDVQKVNGAAIATTGNLTINGGKIIGPGKDSTAEQRARSGGLIYANGDSLHILGGELIDGFGTGYGVNVYYERNYLGTAGEDGKRPTINGGGEVIIGGDAFINGGVTIRSSKADKPAKLIVKDHAVIDAEGAVDPVNVRLFNAELYLNDSTTAATSNAAVDKNDANYDISIAYTCQKAVAGFTAGNNTKYDHTFGEDNYCVDCNHYKFDPQLWTETNKLPTKDGSYKLMNDVTVTGTNSVIGEIYIDLNGYKIIRNVAETALSKPQVFSINKDGKLTILDSSEAGNGSVSIQVENDAAIEAYSAVIHVAEGGEFTLEGGIIDGSNVDNIYVNANNGTISVGGKLTVNGGVIKGFKRGSSAGGAIGAWAGTEVLVTGGKIYAGGSFLNDKDVQKVNGAAIATTGNLTITGGEIIGPGKDATPEQRSRSGGLIYANGDSLRILGGKFYDGYGTGYGFNIYYERNYLGVAGEDGKRPAITGGGEVTINNALVKGGITIRSSKAGEPAKLMIGENTIVDATGAVAATNIRLFNANLHLNGNDAADAVAPADANYDISLAYNCQKELIGWAEGNKTAYDHIFGDDHLCDKCGYDKNTPIAWTDGTKLPTSGNYYLDVDVETTAAIDLTGDLYLDLKGHTVTHKALSAIIKTGTNKLIITDTSELKNGKITTTTLNGSINALIYVQAGGEFTLEAGMIDASNVTNTYTGANAGAITVGNGKIGGVAAYGKATITGGVVKGWKSGGLGSAIGMMNLTTLEIHGGEIIGNTVTAGVSGAGFGGTIMANGHLTITGGTISGGTAEKGGDNIFVNNAGANVIISGGTIDGGVQLNAYASCVISGTVTINEGANYGLKIKSGKVIDVTGLTGGEIYIDADGKFTTDFSEPAAAEAVMGLLKSGDNTKKLALDGNAIKTAALLSLALSKTEVELEIGGEETITATVDPAEATLTWTSSDETVATVVNGKITAVAAGTATITVKATYNGLEITKTCAVTVNAPAVEDPIETRAWVEWTDGTKLPTAGKYKLMTNITVSAGANLTGELWIDLNGYTITSSAAVYNNNGNKLVIDDLSGKTGDQLGKIVTTATSANASGSVIQVGAVANGAAGQLILNNGIIDGTTVVNSKANATTGTVGVTNATNSYSSFIMNGGIIKGQKSSVMTSGVGGSALALHNGTTFVMNGGEIYSHSAGSTAANVCCTGTCINAGTATITINGGTLYAGRAQNHGGAIYTKGNLTMNGGTIVGCQSQNSGAIYSEGDQVTILGGMIYGGKTVANPGNGGAVDKYKGTVTIGGNAVIGGGVNVRGSAKLVLKDAPIINTNLGLQQRFDIRVNGGSIHLNDASSAAIQSANGYYSLTYGTDGKVNGVAAFAANAQTESATIPTKGNVKLTGPVTLTEAIVTTGDLVIDLNGKTVTMTGTTFAIKAMHTVIITDSSAEKTGKIVNATTSLTSDAAVLYITAGKKAVLLGGTLDGSAVTNGFASGYSGTVTVGNYASFIMAGGEVKGQCMASTGSTGKGGSCVGGWGNSVIVINGGTLTAKNKGTNFPSNAVAAQGTCISSGGNVFVHGGQLYGTMATNHGANIYTTGNLTITGGLISGGYANNSGLINCSGASCTITGGTLVGGTAHSSTGLGGASIDYAKDGGILTIGGNAKIAGGVSIRGGAKLVLKDKAVIDMNMAGQTQKKFNIQIKSGACSIWLNEATGTALASASSGKWDVQYDKAGNITGIIAK